MGEEKNDNPAGGGGVEEKKEKETIAEAIISNNDDEIIVIKVDMHCHCEACAKKIYRALRAYQGVEDVAVDRKTNTVLVKGKTAEPLKLCDRIRHKTGRNAQLLSPMPKAPQGEKPEKQDENKVQPPPHKDQPPPAVTVVLGVHMHCEACAQLLRKRIRKIKGVESVETDVGKGQVIVKGVIGDPEVLVKYVHKRTRKQVSILKDDEQDNKQENSTTTTTSNEQENNKKDDEKENIINNNSNNDNTIIDQDAKMMMMMGEINSSNDYYWPSARYDYMIDNYNHHNNLDYHQPPQMFSDENPNACSIM